MSDVDHYNLGGWGGVMNARFFCLVQYLQCLEDIIN